MGKKLLNFCALLGTVLVVAACSSDIDEDIYDSAAKSRALLRENATQVVDFNVNIDVSTVICSAKIINIGEKTLKKYGVYYSSVENEPGFGKNKCFRRTASNIDEEGNFTVSFKPTYKDSTYYARTWAIVNDPNSGLNDTIFSETIDFMITTVNPTIELMPIVNRARLGAVAFAKFTSPGNVGFSKWGISYSTKSAPTVDDPGEVAKDTCKIAGYTGEFGAFFQTLEPKTLYHVRAYVITEEEDTVYSNERIFRTSLGGRYSWQWAANYDGAVAAGAADRITVAMDSAAYYYNNYSNLYLSAHVEYNSGVPTADCSYGGWIRFGANSRYQWVGTAQHETSHGLGVGLAWNWRTLIDYNGSRIWTGKCAQRTLRAIMHDQSQNLKGDNQHMWPGGINQREEVTNGTTNSHGESIKNERMLRGNAMICNALQIDGLATP